MKIVIFKSPRFFVPFLRKIFKISKEN
ncbi:MAG: stage V sporulation protein SpoVM [Clostridia bacterium]|nr:stage V sporulation protein SpoVM [Clostridia bacterium]